jgi:hypothetical protein
MVEEKVERKRRGGVGKKKAQKRRGGEKRKIMKTKWTCNKQEKRKNKMYLSAKVKCLREEGKLSTL